MVRENNTSIKSYLLLDLKNNMSIKVSESHRLTSFNNLKKETDVWKINWPWDIMKIFEPWLYSHVEFTSWFFLRLAKDVKMFLHSYLATGLDFVGCSPINVCSKTI